MSQYNESEKILLLHQYVTSGLTLQEFSSRHGIPLSTFHRIYNRIWLTRRLVSSIIL